MSRNARIPLLALAATVALALSQAASSHFDDKQIPQSYRQSFFALLAANFGPMVAMVKEELPWDQARMVAFSGQLDTLLKLDLLRGFPDGSERGTTRAKPEIWENRGDFEQKLEDLRSEVSTLRQTAEGGDRKAIAQQVAATGEACKACHEEYKAENYLY
jgi:cytochrome c556